MAEDDIKDLVFFVDDDKDIRSLVSEYLTREGFDVKTASEGEGLFSYLKTGRAPDIIILDLMLPGEDGVSLCRKLKSSEMSEIPVLMLTARSDAVDRIIGLESGADDYLTKPFQPRELTARIRAVLRRMRYIPDGQRVLENSRVIAFGEWRLDKMDRCLIDSEDVVTPLSSGDYNLLTLFLDRNSKVISRDEFLDALIGRNNIDGPFDRAIDLRISRLRRCLRDDPRNPAYIRTIRNEGYLFLKRPMAASL